MFEGFVGISIMKLPITPEIETANKSRNKLLRKINLGLLPGELSLTWPNKSVTSNIKDDIFIMSVRNSSEKRRVMPDPSNILSPPFKRISLL
jgi:hypothetical protein